MQEFDFFSKIESELLQIKNARWISAIMLRNPPGINMYCLIFEFTYNLIELFSHLLEFFCIGFNRVTVLGNIL